jgi:hypothetical protein
VIENQITPDTLWAWYVEMVFRYHHYVHARTPLDMCQTPLCVEFRERLAAWAAFKEGQS